MFTQVKGREILPLWLFALLVVTLTIVLTVYYLLGLIYGVFKRMMDCEKMPPKLVEEQKPQRAIGKGVE